MSIFLRCWPTAIREQHSVPHGKLVAYKSYIEVFENFKFVSPAQDPDCSVDALSLSWKDLDPVMLETDTHTKKITISLVLSSFCSP